MFPHTITIYHHSIENGVDKYEKSVKNGFYWNGGTSLSNAEKGIDSKQSITITSNVENARKFGSEWTVNINDKILLGTGEDINSFKELSGAISVKNVAINVCNSDVDNIVITGV